MKKLTVVLFALLAMSLLFTACQNGTDEETTAPVETELKNDTVTTDSAEFVEDYMHYFVNYFHEPFSSSKELSDKDILSLCFRFALQNKESLDFVTEDAELSLLYINGEKLQKAAELLVGETISLKDFHSSMEDLNAEYSSDTDTYTVGYATDYWGGDPYYLVEDEPLEISEAEDTITVIAKVQFIPQLGTVENIRTLKYCFSKTEENGVVYFHIDSISEL